MDANQLILKMIFDRWNGAVRNFDSVLNSLTNEQLETEIAPGKNRGLYLVGHLIAVHDDMLILLDMGEKLYPDFSIPFISLPDTSVSAIPSAAELRVCWTKHRDALTQKFENTKPEVWFEKHTAVSPEDFIKEPHRNKLNIILTRTTHLTYHTGQLALLK